MNLIGHLACAERLSPGSGLGAMLPDLLSLYDRRVRPLNLLRAAIGSAPRVAGTAELLEGMRFHFHVDAHFHRSPLFLDASRVIREALAAGSQTPGLKRYVVAHILGEMFLDHLLIVENPARLDAFYRTLGLGNAGALEALLAGHPLLEWGAFSGFLARLAAMRFADEYLDRKGLLDRMDRILVRMRQRRLETRERDLLLEGMADQADAVREQLDRFLLDMQAWDPNAAPAAAVHKDLDAAGVDAAGLPGIE